METGKKVAVIGAGSVGSAICYALLLRNLCSELLLVDIDAKRVAGEVKDLQDGAYLSGAQVSASDLKSAGQSNIVIISAGAKQREGESRDKLIDRNHAILKSVIGGMRPVRSDAKIIVVANPVDVLTTMAQNLTAGELPRSQVFGSGTFLDSARLRIEIAQLVNVAPSAVHAYIMGAHGDTQFFPASVATIAGVPLLELPEFKSSEFRQQLADKVRNKAYEIIKEKGATYFGIASIVSSIVESISGDKRDVRPLSCYLEEYECCVSVPVVVGRAGIERRLPLKLTDQERQQLQASAESVKKILPKE